MKKLFFILFISILAGGLAFAELSFVPSFEAEASLKFGVDLDGQISTGFATDATFTAKFTLREEADEEYGEGDVYGWININDFEVYAEVDAGAEGTDESASVKIKWGDIDARLNFGEFVYVNIRSGDFSTSESEFGDAAEGRTLSRTGSEVGAGYAADISNVTDGSSLAVGFHNFTLGGPTTVEVGVESDKTYVENFDNTYALSLKVDNTIIPDLLSHDLIVIADLNNEDDNGLDQNTYAVGYNITQEYTVGDFGLFIPIGLDFAYYSGEGHGVDKNGTFDIGAKLALRFDWSSMNGSTDAEIDTFTGSDPGQSSNDVYSGVEVGGRFAYSSESGAQGLFTYLRLFDDGGDNGIIPIVGLQALLDLDYYLAGDLEGVADLGFGVYVDADLGIVTPYAGVGYTLYDLAKAATATETDNATGAKSVLKAKVGVDVTSIIDNVTLTAEWQSGDLLHEDNATRTKGNNLGLRLDQATASKFGEITIGAKISF